MLHLHQMVDPDFMAHIVPTAGQVFVREAASDIVMVVGLFYKPEGKLQMEHQYPVRIEFDTSQAIDRTTEGHGSSLDGLLTQGIWGLKRGG